MADQLETDAEKLIRYRNWESNILTALEAPETASAYGGMPDTNGGNSIGRMGGRAELLSELRTIQEMIATLEAKTEDGPYQSVTLGVT